MEAADGTAQTPLAAAFDTMTDGLSQLLTEVDGGGLSALDAPKLLGFLQEFEVFRNRLSLVDHRVVAEAERVQLAGHFTHASLSSLLVSALRVSPGEASRRIRAAAAVGPRITMLGETLAPVRPGLAAAQQVGSVSSEQVAIVVRALDDIDRPGLDPAGVTRAEDVLVAHAVTFGPRDLRKIATHLIDVIHPDGTVPDEQLIADRRDLRLSALSDGSFRCEGRLTPTLAALLTTACSPLAKPRSTTVPGPHGGRVAMPDPRHHGQRMHDALEEALGRLLAFGDRAATGGTSTSLIVTIDANSLLDRVGHGETADGTLLSAREVLRLADQADILPAVLTRSGALLDLGRSRRIASHTQTLALIARDLGCTFPGCTHPPQYCDRHHIIDWLHGGATDVDNLTLLCRYHHTHFVGHGWTCQLTDDGIIAWTPPAWLDRAQTPLVNHRIRRHVDQRGNAVASVGSATRSTSPTWTREPLLPAASSLTRAADRALDNDRPVLDSGADDALWWEMDEDMLDPDQLDYTELLLAVEQPLVPV